MEKSLFGQMDGIYHQVGDDRLPDLALPEEMEAKIGGKGAGVRLLLHKAKKCS